MQPYYIYDLSIRFADLLSVMRLAAYKERGFFCCFIHRKTVCI